MTAARKKAKLPHPADDLSFMRCKTREAGGGSAKEKMTLLGLEPLICDADNMLDVLADMLDHTGFTSSDQVITERDHELIMFAVNVAVEMSHKVRKAYYEAIGYEAIGGEA